MKSYLALAVFAPLYPAICIVNDLSESAGYYNFIPQIILPKNERPHSSKTQWPGLQNVPVSQCVVTEQEPEAEPEGGVANISTIPNINTEQEEPEPEPEIPVEPEPEIEPEPEPEPEREPEPEPEPEREPEPGPEPGPEQEAEPEEEQEEEPEEEAEDVLLTLKMSSNDGTIFLIGSSDISNELKLQSIQIDFDNYENVNSNSYSWENINNDDWVLADSGNLFVGSISENNVNILTNTLENGNTIGVNGITLPILVIGNDINNSGNIPILKTDSNNTQLVLYNAELGNESIITARKNPYEGELRLEIVND